MKGLMKGSHRMLCFNVFWTSYFGTRG